jgi:hypothetical protein
VHSNQTPGTELLLAASAIGASIRHKAIWPETKMSTLLIIIILLLIFGGGGGYYAHSLYGGPGLGGVLGTVLVVLLILWLLGVLR